MAFFPHHIVRLVIFNILNFRIQIEAEDEATENEPQRAIQDVISVGHAQPGVNSHRMMQHSEIAKKITNKKAASSTDCFSSSLSSSSRSFTYKPSPSAMSAYHTPITDKSSKEECKSFLLSKEFSNKYINLPFLFM